MDNIERERRRDANAGYDTPAARAEYRSAAAEQARRRDAAAARNESADRTPARPKLLEGISLAQVLAGALAAVTSMLLSSRIGIAGSVIGVAVGSVVATVSSQVYRHILSTATERIRSATPFDAAGGATTVHSEAAPHITLADYAQAPNTGTRNAYGQRATDGMSEASEANAPHGSERDEHEHGQGTRIAPARLRRLAAAERSRTQRRVVVIAVISALVAVLCSALAVDALTGGNGLGTKPQALIVQRDDEPAAATGAESETAQQPDESDGQTVEQPDADAPENPATSEKPSEGTGNGSETGDQPDDGAAQPESPATSEQDNGTGSGAGATM